MRRHRAHRGPRGRATPGSGRARVALALLAAFACSFATASVEFSAAEIDRIASLGPWPPPALSDTSNRVSQRPDAIELGRRLFFDARLSPVGYIACVTCHQPDRGWTDRKPRAHGLGDVDRNTQALNNVGLQRWFGWGGNSDSLWMASLRPILDAREMDSNPAHVRRVYVRAPEYACLYHSVYGVDPVSGGDTDEAVLVRTAKALAAFTATLTTDRTPFDVARDALARGEPMAVTGYPAAAQRGLALFVGKGNCVACHSGPTFSDGAFHDTGVAPFVGQRVPDTGRQQAVAALRSSPFSLLGRYNDDTSRRNATATRRMLPPASGRGQFRTPSLRNVAVTAPYMHNGSLDDLRDVVGLHAAAAAARLAGRGPPARSTVDLDAAQIEDLIAFLQTLSDDRGEDRGLPAARVTPCDDVTPPER